MNYSWTFKKVRCLIILVACSMLSACYSLPEFLQSDSDSNLKSNDYKKGRESFTSRVDAEQSSIERNVKEFIKDWETVRPALMRVVALEQDMQFLLQSMSDVNSIGPLFAANSEVGMAGFESPETKNIDYTMDDPSTSDAKFMQAIIPRPAVDNGNVALKSATPVMSANNENVQARSSNEQLRVDAKFSNNAGQKDYKISENISNKFQDVSATSSQRKYTPALDETCGYPSPTMIGKGSAVHLISYTSDKLLASGSKALSAQFTDVLCGKIPLVKEVEVNGRQFYSMRFGPFLNKTTALEACSTIKEKGQYCGVTLFEGEEIL